MKKEQINKNHACRIFLQIAALFVLVTKAGSTKTIMGHCYHIFSYVVNRVNGPLLPLAREPSPLQRTLKPQYIKQEGD